jgi:hypothetical protein
LLTPPRQPPPEQHVKAAVAKDGPLSTNNAAKRAATVPVRARAVCRCVRMLTTTIAVRSCTSCTLTGQHSRQTTPARAACYFFSAMLPPPRLLHRDTVTAAPGCARFEQLVHRHDSCLERALKAQRREETRHLVHCSPHFLLCLHRRRSPRCVLPARGASRVSLSLEVEAGLSLEWSKPSSIHARARRMPGHQVFSCAPGWLARVSGQPDGACLIHIVPCQPGLETQQPACIALPTSAPGCTLTPLGCGRVRDVRTGRCVPPWALPLQHWALCADTVGAGASHTSCS